MKRRALADYGAPFVDEDVVVNPETEQSAAQANMDMLDGAMMTQTASRASVFFATTATAAPLTYDAADVAHSSVWGSGGSQKPTVAKTATGRYTITYAASFTDELGEIDTLALRPITVAAYSSDPSDKLSARFLTCANNVATIAVYANGVLADVGDSSAAAISLAVWLG